MGDRQRPGQGSNLRWKALPDEDTGDYHLAALGRRPASTANPRLAVSRQSVYPPSDLLPTADSDSVPGQRRAAADVPTLTEDTNPFGHLQSSMGRLSLQSSAGITGKMALGVPRGNLTKQHMKGGKGPLASMSLGLNSSAPPPREQKSYIMPSGYVPQMQTTASMPPRVPLNRTFTTKAEHEYSKRVERHRSRSRSASSGSQDSWSHDDDIEPSDAASAAGDYVRPTSTQTTNHVSKETGSIPRIIDAKYKDPYVSRTPPPAQSPWGSQHGAPSKLQQMRESSYSKESSQSWESETPSRSRAYHDNKRHTSQYIVINEMPKRENSRERRRREEDRERERRRGIREEEERKELTKEREAREWERKLEDRKTEEQLEVLELKVKHLREREREWDRDARWKQEVEDKIRARSKSYLEYSGYSEDDDDVRRSRAKKSSSPKSTDRESATTYDDRSSTGGVNTTISRDSSADESVRRARLLADMGKRSQRTRNGSDMGPTSAEPRRYMEDVDEDGYSTEDVLIHD